MGFSHCHGGCTQPWKPLCPESDVSEMTKLQMGKINHLPARSSSSCNLQKQMTNQILLVGIRMLKREGVECTSVLHQ